MHRQRFLFTALAILTVWRLAMLPTCELSPGEAMSALAAAQPGWTWGGTSPVLTILARIGTLIGGHSEFGVRLLAPLLAVAASLLVWRLAMEWFDEQTAAWSVVILNVIPAFNLAAIHLTPGSIAFPGYAGLALGVAIASRRPGRWHRAWTGAAVCMAALVFADGGNVVALVAVVCALLVTPVWRGRLAHPGFWMVVAVWLAGVVAWVMWRVSDQWPGGGGLAGLQPEWRIIPSVFRWVLLASPLLLFLMGHELSRLIKPGRSAEAGPSGSFVPGFSLPLLIADFGWGVWRAWPDTGHAAWVLFAAIILAHRSRQMLSLSLEAKVSIRTTALALAAAQSLPVMHTDLLRSAGLPWEFAQRVDERRTYTRFLSADPAGSMNGWRETEKIIRHVMAADPTNGWTLVADHWRLAAPLSFYAGREVQSPETGIRKPAPGGNALFITDDARCKAVPTGLARAFERTRIVSVAEIMHGGHKVRTVKIFACLHNRAPDL